MSDPKLQEDLEKRRTRSQEFVDLVGPYAEAILVKTPVGRFAVPVADQYLAHALRVEGKYGNEQISYLKALCSAETRLLVVGAHVGAITIPLAKVCKEVVALEPNPQIFDLLQLNLHLNDVRNCRPICVAANHRRESLDFIVSSVNSGGSKRKPKTPWLYFFDEPELTKVEAMPLDDLLADESFDIVVMDIEGSEFFALQGMQRILKDTEVLQIEFLAHHLKYVSGVTPQQFAALLLPHFSWMRLSNGWVIKHDEIEAMIKKMYDADWEDYEVVFFKKLPV